MSVMTRHNRRIKAYMHRRKVQESGRLPHGGSPREYPELGRGRAKAERQMNMALHLKAAGETGIKPARIYAVPRYDDSLSIEALEKRWDRDKVELIKLGLNVQWHNKERYVGEGYTIDVSSIDLPTGPVKMASARYFHILWVVEQGYKPTVKQLADYLGVSEDTIREDVHHMSFCCCGKLPHEYLDARVEDDIVVITGPRLYS